MQRTAQIVVGIGAAMMLVYFGYTRRAELNAKLWHLIHGHSVLFGGYQIPVPEDWTVTDQEESDFTLAAARTDGAVISVSEARARLTAPRDVDFWVSVKHKLLSEQGLTEIVDHSVQYDGGTAACVAGSRHKPLTFRADSIVVDMDCVSTGPLNFIFLGRQSELPDFDRIVSQIKLVASQTRN